MLKTLTISVGISNFSENKKQNRYIIMNLLYFFSVTSVCHVIIDEKELLKHNILTHCLTFSFRHMPQYNSFPSVFVLF